jgi:hypothetical protein
VEFVTAFRPDAQFDAHRVGQCLATNTTVTAVAAGGPHLFIWTSGKIHHASLAEFHGTLKLL